MKERRKYCGFLYKYEIGKKNHFYDKIIYRNTIKKEETHIWEFNSRFKTFYPKSLKCVNIFWNNLHILHSIKVSIKNVKKNELESNIFCFVPMPIDWSKDTVAYYYHCKFYPCYFYKKNHDQAKSLNLLYLWIGVDKFCFSVTCEFHRNRLLRFWDNVTEKADYKAIAIRSSVERKTLITPNIKKKIK